MKPSEKSVHGLTEEEHVELLKGKVQPKRARLWRARGSVFLRDALPLTSWILVGATAQSLVMLLAPQRLSRTLLVAPTLAMTLYKLVNWIVGWSTYKPGSNGEILTSTTASFDADPKSDGGICCFLLGFRSHHPGGVFFDKQTKAVGDFFMRMDSDLADRADEFGFLGGQTMLNASHADSGNGVVNVYYFRNVEGLHRFAHSKTHLDGWKWWTENHPEAKHLGLMHEIFNSPKGNWEAIYINYKPDGLLKTSFQADDELGKPTWQSPLIPVAGRGGNMRTSLGRMGRTDGKDNGATGNDPWTTPPVV